MVPEGYSQVFILVIFVIGIPLAMVRPYGVFLFSCMLMVAGSRFAFISTRTAFFGPYLNMGDACVLIALLGLVVDKWQNKARFSLPSLLIVILSVLFVAAMQSFAKLGWTYYTLRAVRWSMAFPIGLFLGVNFVNSPRRAKFLIGAILAGVVLAALQHCRQVAVIQQTLIVDSANHVSYRTIDFIAGGVPCAFLLAGMIWKFPKALPKRLLFLAVGSLLVISLFLNQTRSIWFALIAAVPVTLIVFQQNHRFVLVFRDFILSILVCIIALGIFNKITTETNLVEIATDRIFRLLDTSEHASTADSRIRAFKTELHQWYKGTLFFGRGLQYFQNMDFGRSSPEIRIAYGHLGYVTYLSQLGLIGLFVYGVYLPLSIVRRARIIWLQRDNDSSSRYLALLGGGCIIYLSIMFLMSSSLLGLDSFAPGILGGSVLALSQRFTVQRAAVRTYRNNYRFVRALGA